MKNMNKNTIISLIVAALVILFGVIGFLMYRMHQQKTESLQMLELVEMDKREMENEYEQFAMQYNEMKMQIKNDSLVAQLEKEQQRTEEIEEYGKYTQTKKFAEEIAKEILGLVHEGEILFKEE